MSLTHLSADELAVWNALDKAVGRFLKDPKRNLLEIGNFDARTAASLRDRIGNPNYPASSRATYIAEAKQALETDEWAHSSVWGSGGDDDG